MTRRNDKTKMLLVAETRVPEWLHRWTNTIIVVLMWPCIFIGFLYLAVFFILNSSYGPKILHSQLSGFLRGDYYADTMSTDAILKTLTMTNVRLSEAGKSDHVIFVPKVEAKIPIVELVDLITDTTLTVNRIKAYDADVYLDFTHGELNILKVVLPYFSKPEPPDPEPGNFVVNLADLNVSNTAVHLVFDGFRIDLLNTEVDHFALRAGQILEMISPMARNNNNVPAVRVGNGSLTFNPALFSFSLSSMGDEDEGLIMSGGPGSAGKVGYAYQQMVRYIDDILRQSPDFAKQVGVKPDVRGDFHVPLKNTLVDGFNWHGNTFYIPGMTSEIGDGGTMTMKEAMMNVGPTQNDIDDAADKYHHTPSGLLPQESILWAADLDLRLKVEEPILAYFFGPILHGKDQLRLQASMAGDLARVSGDIALDMPQFDTFDVDIARAALRAHMDGQHLTIAAFEADTALGGVLLGGYYDIMDGNFDIDLWAGREPQDPEFSFIDPDFRSRLQEGMTPLDFMPDGELQRFNGLFSSHLKAQSHDGMMAVLLPEDTNYQFSQSFAGIKSVSIAAADDSNQPVLTYKNGIVASPSGLNVSFGSDHVKIAPGLRLNTNNLAELTADVSAHIEEPAVYADYFGVSDVEAGPIDFNVSYYDCSGESCGQLKLKSSNLAYMGIRVPNVDVDLNLDHSSLTAKSFKVDTAFGSLDASITSAFSPEKLNDPTHIPFHVELRITDVDLQNLGIDSLDPLGLHGHGEGTLIVDGPYDGMKARFVYVMNDLEAMDVDISRLLLIARYEDNKVLIPALNLWFKDSEVADSNAQKDGPDTVQRTVSLENNPDNTRKVAGQLNKVGATQAEKFVENMMVTPGRRRKNPSEQPRVARRTPDLSLGALTYDLDTNIVIFNVALQPISPNEFKPFRDLELPVDATVSFDISANVNLNVLMSDAVSNISNVMESTWAEGSFEINDLKYGDMKLGNTQILMSRSSQYTLVKGILVDTFQLAGFVRTAPKFSVSLSLNFPDLEVLDTLSQFGIDLSELATQFNIRKALVSGSLGFCMKNFDDMKASLLIDTIDVDVLGNSLFLTQPAYFIADINQQSVKLNQLELKYRDSVLKMSGNVGLEGDINFDLNGEVDAAIAGSFIDTLKQSSGLLGVSLSARGNMFNHDKISLKNLELSGYLGVRDPISVLTTVANAPIELTKGFFVIDRNTPKCPKQETCLYTPEEQPFTLKFEEQAVALSLFASTKGDVSLVLDGILNAALAQLFVKDVYSTQGALGLKVNLDANILDQNKAFKLDLDKIDMSAELFVREPVSIGLRSLNEPVTLDSGVLQITKDDGCSEPGECIIIPKNNGFRGNLMGGSYLIFGEFARNAIMPKSGNLSITATNVSFRMKDELFLTVSPDIQITAKDLNDFDTVKVSGDIEVAEAKYKKNFDDGSSNFIREQILSLFIDSKKRVDTYSPSFMRKYPFLGKIHLDVGVAAENSINVDVQIATALVELELGSQLRIGGTVKDFAPTGIFSINQGLFSLQGNDFEFQNGAQIAFNGSLDGKIDIAATSEINTTSDAFSSVTGSTDLDRRKRISTNDASSSDLYAITLTVGGTVFRPVWSFESSPYLTDANVYALILTGKTIDDFSGNDVAMESLLSPFFTSQLDTFINADQFKFVFSEGAAQFVYVKQINKGLRIAAAVSIRGSEGNEQALSAEYYFNDNQFIDLTGQNTSDEEGHAPTFKLGARFHWHVPIE